MNCTHQHIPDQILPETRSLPLDFHIWQVNRILASGYSLVYCLDCNNLVFQHHLTTKQRAQNKLKEEFDKFCPII